MILVADNYNDFEPSGDTTRSFSLSGEREDAMFECLLDVCVALSEKGYDPVNQIVGYVMSGDPVYITSHRSARAKISMFSSEELLTSLVKYFLDNR